jgi:hypothetical protein
VKSDKLAKQLKKELTRNPKKTIALGLVTVVALWFWAPLVWKYAGGGSKKSKAGGKAAVAEAAPAAAQPAAEIAKGPAPAPKIDWDKLLEHIADDERMLSATLPKGARDPFAPSAQEEQVVAAQPVPDATGESVKPVTLSDPDPKALGLVLQGTFVSQRTQRATISGKTYATGAAVKVIAASAQPNDASSNAKTEQKLIAFQLDLIEARRIVLSRNGKQYTLALKPPSLNEEEQLTLAPQDAEQAEDP